MENNIYTGRNHNLPANISGYMIPVHSSFHIPTDSDLKELLTESVNEDYKYLFDSIPPRTYRQVGYFIYSFSKKRPDLRKDLLQDVLCKTIEPNILKKLAAAKSPGSYYTRIIHNFCQKWQKEHILGSIQLISIEDIGEDESPLVNEIPFGEAEIDDFLIKEFSIDMLIENSEFFREVDKILNNHKHVYFLIMRYVQNVPRGVLADFLECSPEQVRKTSYNILQKLRKHKKRFIPFLD